MFYFFFSISLTFLQMMNILNTIIMMYSNDEHIPLTVAENGDT